MFVSLENNSFGSFVVFEIDRALFTMEYCIACLASHSPRLRLKFHEVDSKVKTMLSTRNGDMPQITKCNYGRPDGGINKIDECQAFFGVVTGAMNSQFLLIEAHFNKHKHRIVNNTFLF